MSIMSSLLRFFKDGGVGCWGGGGGGAKSESSFFFYCSLHFSD